MADADNDDEVLDIDGLAAKLKLPKASVYKLVAAERIPGQKVGKHWRFLRSEIDAWLRAGMRSARRPADDEADAVEPAIPGRSGPTHFEAAAPAPSSVAPTPSPFAAIFTASEVAALQERWIETPKQFLAQGEVEGGRRRLAELLRLSEDRLQQKIIEVAMLAGTFERLATTSPGRATD